MRTIHHRGARNLGATATALVTWSLGCSGLIGLEEWTDPPGATTSSSGATSSSGSGGAAATSSSSTGVLNINPNGDPTCADGKKNGLETDVDCGGDACGPCASGKECSNGADCRSGNCAPGGCTSALCCQTEPSDAGPPDALDPICADGKKNGLETDVDCGGDDCGPCPSGKACGNDADCKSGHCAAGGTCL